jgi:hypothetical protein
MKMMTQAELIQNTVLLDISANALRFNKETLKKKQKQSQKSL